MRLKSPTKKAALMLAVSVIIAVTTAACWTKPLSIQQLVGGCENFHAPNNLAAGIRAEKERNPVRFQDQILGQTICITGHVNSIMWPTEREAKTTIIIKGRTDLGVACRLARPDAATIEQYSNLAVSGQISDRTFEDRYTDHPILDNCRIESPNDPEPNTGAGQQ